MSCHHFAPEDLVAGLHVGQDGVVEHVGHERQELIGDHVPEHDGTPRTAQEARTVDDVGDAVLDGLEQHGVIARVVLEVGVLDQDHVAAGGRECRCARPRPCPGCARAGARGRRLAVFSPARSSRLPSCEPSSTTMISEAAPVCAHPLENLPNIVDFVVDGNDDGELHGAAHYTRPACDPARGARRAGGSGRERSGRISKCVCQAAVWRPDAIIRPLSSGSDFHGKEAHRHDDSNRFEPLRRRRQRPSSRRRSTRIEDTKLSPLWLQDLILKVLYSHGYMTGFQIAEAIALPFAGVTDQLLTTLKQEKLIEVKSSQGGLGEGAYTYGITGAGNLRAREALERSQYAGPAPVQFEVYNEAIRRQKSGRLTRHDTHDAADPVAAGDLREHLPAAGAGAEFRHIRLPVRPARQRQDEHRAGLRQPGAEPDPCTSRMRCTWMGR